MSKPSPDGKYRFTAVQTTNPALRAGVRVLAERHLNMTIGSIAAVVGLRDDQVREILGSSPTNPGS